MKRSTSPARVAAGLLGLVFATAVSVPGVARADQGARQIGHYRWGVTQDGARALARGGGPAGAASAGRQYVHERYSRDLPDGCEYRADVRGTVSPVAAARAEASGRGGALDADLAVNASVHCADVARVQAPARRVAVRAASPEALAQRVGERATVRAARGERGRCEYAPRFAFREDTLVNTGVAIACERPRTE